MTVSSRSPPHMSALWMQTTAQANLCSSPPDRSSTFLSRRWLRSDPEAKHSTGVNGRQRRSRRAQLRAVLEDSNSPSCWHTRSCVSVSSFLLRIAPTDPFGQTWGITTSLKGHYCCTPTTLMHETHLPWLSLGSGRHTAAWRWPAGRLPGFWWSSSEAQSPWSKSGSLASLEGSDTPHRVKTFKITKAVWLEAKIMTFKSLEQL